MPYDVLRCGAAVIPRAIARATQILTDGYVPEASREDLAAAIGDALDALGNGGDEDDGDDDELDDDGDHVV